MDDDDWDLTLEEMEALEKEALERINQERNSSSSLRTPTEVFSTWQLPSLGFKLLVFICISFALVREILILMCVS